MNSSEMTSKELEEQSSQKKTRLAEVATDLEQARVALQKAQGGFLARKLKSADLTSAQATVTALEGAAAMLEAEIAQLSAQLIETAEDERIEGHVDRLAELARQGTESLKEIQDAQTEGVLALQAAVERVVAAKQEHVRLRFSFNSIASKIGKDGPFDIALHRLKLRGVDSAGICDHCDTISFDFDSRGIAPWPWSNSAYWPAFLQAFQIAVMLVNNAERRQVVAERRAAAKEVPDAA